MAAMEEELRLLCDSLEDRQEKTIGGRVFYTGKMNGIETVAVWSKWGKVSASATATMMMALYKVTSLVFIGVAGATDPALNVGDVVISNKLYQHDMDATPLMKKYEIPLYGQVFFEADSALAQCASASAIAFLKDIGRHIEKPVLDQFGIKTPKAIRGTVASGDKFVSTPEDLANLHPDEKTHAVEMEGAAVAQICRDFNVPFVVIRTISDNADHSAHVDFPKFIKSIASKYSHGIMLGMSRSLLRPAPVDGSHKGGEAEAAVTKTTAQHAL
jgi:adenosylhomocysteine nucleosidase